MRKLMIAVAALATLLPTVAVDAQNYRGRDRDRGRDSDYSRYDYDRPDPRYGNYDAQRYYRGGDNRRTRRLANDDRVYRGRNGRYYCRRDDGTTGLIIGGIGGGLLGNAIRPGGSGTLGALLGAGGGALLGRSLDRNDRSPGVTCR